MICLPSGEKATESTGDVCVPMRVINLRPSASHKQIVLSSPAETTSMPTGETSTD
jgi:hypothetical protein